MARLAKHFRMVANLEYLLDLIEGTVQEENRKDESSKRSSTSRKRFLHAFLIDMIHIIVVFPFI